MGKDSFRIFVFRHGQTDWNKEGRVQGHLDVPLNEAGRAEAHRLALGLRRVRLDAILTSDLSRAVHTAELALAEAMAKNWHAPIPILPDSRFREVLLGKLQGLTRTEIREQLGDAIADRLGKKILSDEELVSIGSEKVEAILDRIYSGLDEVTSKFAPGAALGLSTHGGVIRRLLHHGGSDAEVPSPVPNAVFFPFEYIRGERRLRFHPRTEISF